MEKLDISNVLSEQNPLLNDALKQRQGFIYNLASTLAQTPVQQGYGSWLSNLTNAFGRAYQGGIESNIARQKAQDLSASLQSGNLSDAAKVAAVYGDTGLAQQLLTAQVTNDYRQAQLEESRLNRELNRAIKEQELAQKAEENEAQRQYYLDQLGLRRDELAGTQAYRQDQLDIQRAGLEQDAAKLAQQAAENEAQRAYLMKKLGTETQLSQADQDLRRAQLYQTGAYNAARLAQTDAYNNARLAQAQAKLDNEIDKQKATADYYAGKNVDYSKLPVSVLKEIAEKQEKMQKEVSQMETTGSNLSDLYQTVAKNPITFSAIGGVKQDEEARALRSAVTTKGLTDMGHHEFMYLNSIMPKGFSTAINTAAEQKLMRPYTTQFDAGTGSAKKAAIKNMLGDIYDSYKNEALAQGFEMPISKQDYINQRIKAGRPYNAKYFTGASDQMYEPTETGEQNAQVIESTAAEDFMRGTI